MSLPPDRKLEKTRAFSKDVEKLPRDIVKAGWKAAQLLQRDIFTRRLNLRKLEGYDDVWRVVVRKDYRMIYTFDEERIYLLRFAHRKDIYRLDFTFD